MDEGFYKSGDRIHGYVVERLAAVGGVAAVYEARDPTLGRTVAIKVLRHALPPGHWGWRSIEREGRSTARLDHPAFVTVYEVFPHGDGVALVMEWVEGCTLAERLARGPMGRREAKDVFSRLASGLAAAHDARVVHGDLSPANVMIRADGRVKLLDPAPAGLPTGDGPAIANPDYAAPEVVAGGSPSAASDVFSFGALLAEAIHLSPGPNGGVRPPSRLARLARKCMQEDPARRPPDGTALQQALRSVQDRLASASPMVLAAGSIAAALMLMAGLNVIRWQDGEDTLGNPVWNGIERLQTNGSCPVLLEDGSAVVCRTHDDLGIEVLPLDSGLPRVVWRGTKGIGDLAVFPDGDSIVFVARDENDEQWLWEIDMDGGLPRKIAPGTAPTISEDGTRIAAIEPLEDGSRRIVILDRSGGSVHALQTFRDSLIPVSVVFGRSGKRVIVAATDGVSLSRLLEISLEDGHTKPIVDVAGVAAGGAEIDGDLDAVVWPVRTTPRGGASLMVTSLEDHSTRVVYPGPGRASNPSMDRDGRLLSFQLTEYDQELVEIEVHPDGGPPVAAMKILAGTRGASQPRISPDPKFLLFQSATGMVQLMDRTTGKTRSLLPEGSSRYNAVWSPDGKRIVCAGLATDRSSLWVVGADGGAPECLTEEVGNSFQPVWHPDGRHILFVSDRQGIEGLFVLNLGGGPVSRLGDESAANPAVSSDGSFLAYVVGAFGPSPRLRLARLNRDVSDIETVWERPVVVNRWAGAKPRFSPDGQWLAFDQPRPGVGADIWAVPVEEGGTARAIQLTAFPFPASLVGWFDWGPDWKIVATVSRRTDRICILHDAESWLQHAR